MTVTLTLTSSAAEDIMGVLRDLANILHIPAPTSYQIVERTSTPPSQKLGLYRTKGKDGKEGGKAKYSLFIFVHYRPVKYLKKILRNANCDIKLHFWYVFGPVREV